MADLKLADCGFGATYLPPAYMKTSSNLGITVGSSGSGVALVTGGLPTEWPTSLGSYPAGSGFFLNVMLTKEGYSALDKMKDGDPAEITFSLLNGYDKSGKVPVISGTITVAEAVIKSPAHVTTGGFGTAPGANPDVVNATVQVIVSGGSVQYKMGTAVYEIGTAGSAA